MAPKGPELNGELTLDPYNEETIDPLIRLRLHRMRVNKTDCDLVSGTLPADPSLTADPEAVIRGACRIAAGNGV